MMGLPGEGKPLTPSAVSNASVALPVEVVDVLAVDDVALVVELVVPVDELVEETVVIPERTTDRVAG